MESIEAFAQLAEYAAAYTPNCAKCFVNNLGAVLTGHSDGNSAMSELWVQLGWATRDPSRGAGLGASGFAWIFRDPGLESGGNQALHFWFYVQVAFEKNRLLGGETAADIGSVLHETILAFDPSGRSLQDMFLGFEGSNLGTMLKAGTVSPVEVGNWVRNNLSPNSSTANFWLYLINPQQKVLDNMFIVP